MVNYEALVLGVLHGWSGSGEKCHVKEELEEEKSVIEMRQVDRFPGFQVAWIVEQSSPCKFGCRAGDPLLPAAWFRSQHCKWDAARPRTTGLEPPLSFGCAPTCDDGGHTTIG
jgi:hypothetical protein